MDTSVSTHATVSVMASALDAVLSISCLDSEGHVLAAVSLQCHCSMAAGGHRRWSIKGSCADDIINSCLAYLNKFIDEKCARLMLGCIGHCWDRFEVFFCRLFALVPNSRADLIIMIYRSIFWPAKGPWSIL
jgi:hypothetical protein